MVIVPLRASPAFAATVNFTVPLPVADETTVTVIHGTFATAVHAQSPRVGMLGVPSPPANGTPITVGEIENVQGAAACASMKVCVAIVAVPVRAAPGLAAIFSCTGPAPVPAAPEAIVTHDALEAAVHGQ